VLFRPKPDLPKADRDSLAEAFARAIREIPDVRGVRVGRRVTHGAGYEQTAPDLADILIVIDFDDLAGLQAYLRHPAHAELGARFTQASDAALVYDFEVGNDLEGQLRQLM
jgi:Stress responsive A/B Barrel Domain